MFGLSRKVEASLTAALLFFVISSPFTYTFVDSIINSIVPAQYAMTFRVADGGRPTNFGLMLHAAVYGLITYQLMG